MSIVKMYRHNVVGPDAIRGKEYQEGGRVEVPQGADSPLPSSKRSEGR